MKGLGLTAAIFVILDLDSGRGVVDAYDLNITVRRQSSSK